MYLLLEDGHCPSRKMVNILLGKVAVFELKDKFGHLVVLGVVEDIRVVGDAGERPAVEQRLHIAADDGGYRDAVTALHHTNSYTRSVYSRRIGAYEEIEHVRACSFGSTEIIKVTQAADRFKCNGFFLSQA